MLKNILTKNEYPSEIVAKEIEKFIKKKQDTISEAIGTKIVSEDNLNKNKTRFIVLPYVSNKADRFAFRLKKLVKENFPQVEFSVAFKTPNTIGSMFPFKDNIKNILDSSLVIYKLRCKGSKDEECGQEYIRKTQRILRHRIKEHSRQASYNKSACYTHTFKFPDHEIDYEGVEVIDSASSDRKLQVKESLHILKKQPELNKQINSEANAYNIKTLIVKAYPQHHAEQE